MKDKLNSKKNFFEFNMKFGTYFSLIYFTKF